MIGIQLKDAECGIVNILGTKKTYIANKCDIVYGYIFIISIPLLLQHSI